jgi:hypothetical protein
VIITRDYIKTNPSPYNNARDLIHPGADDYKQLAQKIKTILDEPTLV